MSRISLSGGIVSSIFKTLMSWVLSDGSSTETIDDGETVTIQNGDYATVSQSGSTMTISGGSPSAGSSDFQLVGSAGNNSTITGFDDFAVFVENNASLISGNSGTGDVLIQSLSAGTIEILSGNDTITFDANILQVDTVSGRVIQWGDGSPETVVTASPGSIYLNRNGGAGTTLYIKESGTGNTGWQAK